MNQPTITLKLYGPLRERFGKTYTFVGRAPIDGIRALLRMKKGFQQYLVDHSEPGFHVYAGTRDLGEDELQHPTNQVVKIVPAVVGASAVTRVIVGVALVALSFVPGLQAFSPYLMSAGISMILGGAAELLAKPPSLAPPGMDKGPQDSPTYAFQGPHMTTGQGNCVPLGYGRLRIGGALISLGISPETWPKNGFGGAAPDEAGTMGGDGDTSPWVWAVAPA